MSKAKYKQENFYVIVKNSVSDIYIHITFHISKTRPEIGFVILSVPVTMYTNNF
jgi:hypothetical protein